MSRRGVDRLIQGVLASGATMTGAVVLLIIAFLLLEALPALREIGVWRFFTDPAWQPTLSHPGQSSAAGQFDLTPLLLGTAFLAVGALALAIPAGVISAVFCRFYAPPPVAGAFRRLLELLAGIPSVVYGFWGLVCLVPLIRRLHPPGQSLLAGCLILGLMILPTVALLSLAALRSVPQPYLAGAAALGLGRWATVRSVALPAAAPGIATGISLAAARAVGETMAVLMVSGNVVQVPKGIFDPVRALTSNIALEMGYATAHHRSALFVGGLLLIVVVAGLMLLMDPLERRRVHA